MKMLRFRVRNYKKTEDSGWIHTKNITAFVGKNEAGKSAIFRGLSKLNSSDGSTYDGLKEFPRRRLTDEFDKKDWPVSSAEFELDECEKFQLKEISSSFSKVTTIIFTRYHSNKYFISYTPAVSTFTLTTKDYVPMLEKWKETILKMRSPEGKGEILQPLKDNLVSMIDSQISSIGTPNNFSFIDASQISDIFSNVNSQISEDWQETLFKKIIDDISSLNEKYKNNLEIKEGNKWVRDNIPEFIYFDKYDILDSAIHIDDFIRILNERPDDPNLRITKCLFEHVGLDLEKIRALDPNDDKKTNAELQRMADERAIKMSAASQAMTEKFTSWWEQRKHKFRYQIDGKNFRVWVSDDLDPSEIELDQRSAGMQYFFSFYLIFLVEAQGEHANSILLLDEPGMQFHGTAQQKTVEFLNKISNENQLLYTTHSPFMIDGDHLETSKLYMKMNQIMGLPKFRMMFGLKTKTLCFHYRLDWGILLHRHYFIQNFSL